MEGTAAEIKVLRFKAPNGVLSTCQYVVVRDIPMTLVIMIQAKDNQGVSVTNAVETIATALFQGLEILPVNTMFIEHYPADGEDPHRFDLVNFGHMDQYSYQRPRWIYISSGSPIYRLCHQLLYGEEKND